METVIKTAKGLENLPQAKIIRKAVFIDEQGFVNEFDGIDSQAVHAVVFVDDKPAATGRLFKDDSGWHIGRVAVMKEYRHLHLGSKIMQTLEAYAKKLGAVEITLSAQERAKDFYEKIGYENMGNPHLDEGCPHITMRLKL
ncbi:MAG: GNAT family N-acetyltransferase [Oscillospiraceae bacterium]